MPPSKRNTFGQRLKAWRLAQKPEMSQLGAAKYFGVSKRTLQNWEQEHRKPMLELAEAILARLSKDGF